MVTIFSIRIKISVFVIAILATTNLSAQKVGLVLSGGGAKGLAHVGVLKALEENQIPIDYIAGTSFGAIIGGLYAIGYSPEKIEELVTSSKFIHWVQGKVDKKYVYYFKKLNPTPSWVNFKFRFDSIFQTTLPTNLISPLQMDFAFMKIFSGAKTISNSNFDELFIPFRCVASDIKNNKSVVLRKGDIGKAIRASMTFPFFFKPISIDSVLMFDGGMYNNFPADVVYNDFFPDIIIGSKVAGNYDPPNPNDIFSQIRAMLMENTDYSVICDNGVLIEPTLKNVNIIDFSKGKEFIDSGYTATLRKINQIRLFVTDSVSKEEISKKREEFIKKIPPLLIDKINISGLKDHQAHYVNKLLIQKGDAIYIDELKNEYFKLLADDKIKYIYPKAKYNNRTGFYDLYLEIEKGEDFIVQYGGVLSSGPINSAFVQVQYKYLGKQAVSIFANSHIGRFYSSAQILAKIDYPTRIPICLSLSFTYNQWDYFKTYTYFFEDKTPSYLILNDNYAKCNIGLPLGKNGKLEAGVAFAWMKDEYYQTNTFSRVDTADLTNFNVFVPNIKIEFNTLNRKTYASKGFYFFSGLKYFNGNEESIPGSTSLEKSVYEKNLNWFHFKLKYDNYFNHFGPLSLGFYGEILISNQGLFNNYIASVLSAPAFQPIPESKTLFQPNFRAHNYFAAGLKSVFKIYKNLDFRLEGYIFQPYQAIVLKQNQVVGYGEEFATRRLMGSGAIVYHSPLGPLSISLNYYDELRDNLSLIFCFGYIIHNEKTIE